MNQEQLDTIGRTLAVELGLKMNKLKRYSLAGGSKTNEGLLRTVVRILNDNGITATIPEETEQPTVLKMATKRRVVIMKAVAAPMPYIELDTETMAMTYIDDIAWLPQKAVKELMRTGRTVAARKII